MVSEQLERIDTIHHFLMIISGFKILGIDLYLCINQAVAWNELSVVVLSFSDRQNTGQVQVQGPADGSLPWLFRSTLQPQSQHPFLGKAEQASNVSLLQIPRAHRQSLKSLLLLATSPKPNTSPNATRPAISYHFPIEADLSTTLEPNLLPTS